MADFLERLTKALSGQYEIERELGSGGMATVYLAHDVKHDRQVALKVLKPDLAAALGTERFPREVRIAAQLQHPHILPLHDSGEVDGFLYYVMPFVEGESLRAKLRREGPLPIHDALRILKEVVDALAAAHAHGIVHRDMKPDNVMISGRHAMVMDFGVAKAVSAAGGDTLTTVGIAVGTPQYMAPEQAMAEPNIDARADIYAVGVLAFEMLTGEPIFAGKSPQAMLSAHVIEKPPDVREKRANVPPPLAEAIARCLEKNPADRWQSADELLRALEAVPVTASGGLTPTDTRPYAAAKRRAGRIGRGAWIAIAATVVLAAGALGAWFVIGHRAAHGIQRIGVLPIQDVSGKDAVFVAALQDALTNAIGRLGTVGVASRGTMMDYAGKSVPTKQIAHELNLDAVVEATVFRAGNVIRVNIEMEDPVATRDLWVTTYEHDATDVLQTQTDIANLVAAAVKRVLSGSDSTGKSGAGI
jgi:eukaryotic-like serine/threonine-protein kinase